MYQVLLYLYLHELAHELVAFKACKLELISQPEINLVHILSCNQKGDLR